jgi:hypothetical protein
MPGLGSLLWLSALAGLVAIIYRNPEPLTRQITESIPYKIFLNIFEETHCYITVRTQGWDLPHAECFSVRDGKFKRVFLDETSPEPVKAHREGHVLPGLWDGHGHLMQFGELLNSVDLFGSSSMDEVKQRLVQYKGQREEAGTSEQWLRGVGWDQAHFDGKWPVAVCILRK